MQTRPFPLKSESVSGQTLLLLLLNNNQHRALSAKDLDPEMMEVCHAASQYEESGIEGSLGPCHMKIFVHTGCAQIHLYRAGTPLACALLAWGPDFARGIWSKMLEAREVSCQNCSIPVPPSPTLPARLPWLAVFLSPDFVLGSDREECKTAVGMLAATSMGLLEQVQDASPNN